MIEFVLFLIFALPISWFYSEFQERRSIRIILGILAILMCFGVAWVSGIFRYMDANAYFGAASKDLIQNTIVELESGNTDRVISELKKLRSRFEPSYETKDDFDKKVAEYVQAVADSPIEHDPGDPSWTTDPSEKRE
ncbi:MAG: hypothetical protein RH917_12310 [Lacipirellulaceae bacterium]